MSENFIARLERRNADRFAVGHGEANSFGVLQNQADLFVAHSRLDQQKWSPLKFAPADVADLRVALIIHDQRRLAGFEVAEVSRLAARRQSIGMHRAGIHAEGPRINVRILDAFRMNEQKAFSGVAHQHALAGRHVGTGIYTHAISHTELGDFGDRRRFERNGLPDCAYDLNGLTHFGRIARCQQNPVNTLLEHTERGSGVLRIGNLDHQITALCDQILEWDDGPVAHAQNECLVRGCHSSALFILFRGDFHLYKIAVRLQVPVRRGNRHPAQLAHAHRIACLEKNRISAALKRCNCQRLVPRHDAHPDCFHRDFPWSMRSATATLLF